MKFTCEKYLLSLAVATAGRAAASKSPIPAMEGLLIEAGHNVRVTGYDLKKGIYTTFEADVSAPGSVVINAKLFGDIVRKLPDGIVSVCSDENNAVNIACGNADYNISGTASDDFPDLPSLDYCSNLSLPQDTMARMIAETSFAISTNESRPVYTGALIEVDDNIMTMVAVDGYRMALRREPVETCDVESLKFIVPGAALSDLEKICMSPEEPVKIAVGSKHVSFSVGDTVLISRRLEGEFLNFRKTVPGDFPIQLKAQRADLIRCTDRVSLIIDDRTKNPLRCVFGENMLTITCATPLGRAEDCCPLEGDGGGMIVGFNNSYLMDAFKAAPADTLRINIVNGSAPCIITPEDGGDSFLLLQGGRCEFSPGVNVIAGANAQGKTTLLEAVYMFTGAKSFRTYYDKELIAFEKDEAAVRGEYFASEREQRMEILLRRGRTRTMKRNGVKLSAGETEQCLKAILFSPDDLAMIRGAASLRRRMLDAAITQLRPGYGALIAEYRRLQENKTRILRDWREKPSLLDTLDVFSDGMCMCSAKIIRYRASFARRLAEAARSVQSDFSRGTEDLTLTYTTVSTVKDPAAAEREIYEAVSERQRQLRGAEIESGLCLVGAHKDDLLITINGADARSYASQGQTRTAALSLKLAEREIFLAETGETPVLLLDDVLSELDSARQEFVLNRIGGGQTLVSCCEAASVERMTGGRVLYMDKGRVNEVCTSI